MPQLGGKWKIELMKSFPGWSQRGPWFLGCEQPHGNPILVFIGIQPWREGDYNWLVPGEGACSVLGDKRVWFRAVVDVGTGKQEGSAPQMGWWSTLGPLGKDRPVWLVTLVLQGQPSSLQPGENLSVKEPFAGSQEPGKLKVDRPLLISEVSHLF